MRKNVVFNYICNALFDKIIKSKKEDCENK